MKIDRFAWKVSFDFHDPGQNFNPRVSSFFLGFANSTGATSYETANINPNTVWSGQVAYSYIAGGYRVQGIWLLRDGIRWSNTPFEPINNLSFSYSAYDKACSTDSVRIDCLGEQDGFCCISKSFIQSLCDRLRL